MSDQRQEVADVEIVLKSEYAGRNGVALDQLRGVGLREAKLIDDDGVIEGTLPADRVEAIRKLDCVAYVRSVFTYIASGNAGTSNRQGPAPST